MSPTTSKSLSSLVLLLALLGHSAYSAILDTNSCSATEFYDISSLDCQACEGDNIQPAVNDRSCICSGNSWNELFDTVEFFPQCTLCQDNNFAPARDGNGCLACPAGISFDAGTRDCACPATARIVEAEDGSGKLCETCPEGSVPGREPTDTATYATDGFYDCVECGLGQEAEDGQCVCQGGLVSAGDFCYQATGAYSEYLTASAATNAASMNYRSVDNGGSSLTVDTTIRSRAIVENFLPAMAGCALYNDRQACNQLANICVLHLGDQDSDACQAFEEINSTKPELYSTVRAFSPDAVAMHVAFPHYPMVGALEELKFYLSVYSFDGEWIGREELTSQFQFCPYSFTEERSFREFGNTIQNSCDINLGQFTSRDSQYFYELFLEDWNGTLIRIPVLVKNLHSENGQKVNASSSSSNWILMNRFFTYDNISGVEESNGLRRMIRYAREIILRVPLQNSDDARIFTPLLIIDFREIYTNGIGEGYAEFLAEYTLDVDSFMTTALTIVILLTVYCFVWGLFKIYVWGKLNPELYQPIGYLGRLMYNAAMIMIQTWSHLMFWCLFLFSAYWFIAFKLQQEAFVLLPPLEEWDENDSHFDAIFGFVLAFHFITVLSLIYRQGNADIFFLDWERPQRVQVQGELKDKVSVWRTLFVANEFDEMQTYRYVRVGMTLLLVLFVLEGLSFDNLAYARPNTDLDDVKAPKNDIIKYFISTIVYITFGFLQIVVPQLLARWFPTSLNTFNDLCQVSNISVFIFDTPLHGYYIHGFSQSGQAEGDAEDLKNALEGVSGSHRHTGLQSQTENELEVYEVFASMDFRSRFDNLFQHHVTRQVELSRQQETSYCARLFGRGLPASVDVIELNKQKEILNSHLKKYIEEIKKSGFGILQKRALQMLLRYPPDEVTVRMTNLPILYRNNWNGYQNVFLCGKDYDLVLLEILVFNLVYIYFDNSALGALFTFALSRLLIYWRGRMGENNLSQKALIDKRFLIQSPYVGSSVKKSFQTLFGR